MPSSRGSSQPRDWTQLSHTAGEFFIIWATSEAHNECYMAPLQQHDKYMLIGLVRLFFPPIGIAVSVSVAVYGFFFFF